MSSVHILPQSSNDKATESGAYGIRTLRSLRQNNQPSVRLQKKIDVTYNYFLNTVDPIIGDLITHMLCEQPVDVPGAMLNYLTKRSIQEKAAEKKAMCSETETKSPEAVRQEEESEAAQREIEAKELEAKNKRNSKRPKKEQKLYLATAIGPVISKLVNRIATTRPEKVVNFLCDELQTMIYGTAEEKEARLVAEIPSDTCFDIYKGQNGPKAEKKNNAEKTKRSEADVSSLAALSRPKDGTSASHSLLGGESNNSAAEVQVAATISTSASEAQIDPVDSSATSNIKKYQFAVVGIDGVGKSSLMNMLQGRADLATKPTIGFRPVTMMLGETMQIRFYDIGGGPKIREIWSQYYHDVHGVIYVVDSTEAGNRLQESVTQFTTTMGHPFIAKKPLLVLGTKKDLEGATSADEIAERYGVRSMPYARTDTCKGVGAAEEVDASLEQGLEWLIEQVKGSFDEINRRVAIDTVSKAKEDIKRRLARERKVLKTKIAIAFTDLLSEENKPDLGDKAPNPEDSFTEAEGINFLSSELGEDKENLPRLALEVAAMCGYQRLALQIVGSLKVPINKKKEAMSWEEIHSLIVDIRVELGLMMPNFAELNQRLQ